MIHLAPSLQILWSYDPCPVAQKDLEAKGQLCHVVAHFKALFMGIFMAVTDFSCNCFGILSSRLEQCGWANLHDRTN